MEKKPTNSKFNLRFFGISPVRNKDQWMYSLIVLEQDGDSVSVIEEKGPYYMFETEKFLKIALGKEKMRISRGVK